MRKDPSAVEGLYGEHVKCSEKEGREDKSVPQVGDGEKHSEESKEKIGERTRKAEKKFLAIRIGTEIRSESCSKKSYGALTQPNPTEPCRKDMPKLVGKSSEKGGRGHGSGVTYECECE